MGRAGRLLVCETSYRLRRVITSTWSVLQVRRQPAGSPSEPGMTIQLVLQSSSASSRSTIGFAARAG
jgi:hypothetical protein